MTNFKNQMNKRRTVVAAGSILAALAIIFLIFFLAKQQKHLENEPEGGKKNTELFAEDEEPADNTKMPEKSEEQDTAAFSEEQQLEESDQREWDLDGWEDMGDDLRIHGFPYIRLTNRLRKGDYVDIRISFADGGDFVLLSKKQVKEIAPLGEEGTNALWMAVSEEEILRLSSAVVDAYLNEGCYIYAIQYVSETQEAAVVNYAVSDLVKQLMEKDPNIVKLAENVQEYPLWREYESGIHREMVYPEQEEIIYMD